MVSNPKYLDSMEPNQSSGKWKKKKKIKGNRYVCGAKKYYSVTEHQQQDNWEKGNPSSSV